MINSNDGNDSIWYYSKNEFKELVSTISDKNITIVDALDTYREIGVLPKELRNITVQELCNDSNLIVDVYNALRKMSPQSRFKFEYKIADRQIELGQMLTSNFGDIDKGRTRTRIISRRHKNNSKDIDFCYALEVAMAPENDIAGHTVRRAGQVQFVGCINDGLSLDGGESYFANGYFEWDDKKSGTPMSAKGIMQLLAECGFAANMENTKRKVPCVLFVNLLTPVPNWMGSAGKTEIDLRPYQKDIAEVVSSLAYKMPTYRGKGLAATYHSTGLRDKQREDKNKATEIFERFLRKRHQEVKDDPTIKLTDRWNTSTPVYRIRPQLEKAGLGDHTRKYLQGLVRSICKNRLHVNREELGIYEEARALMYFKNKIYPVSFEQLQEIKHLGSHIFMVEKHGPIDLEIAFADRYGVALCETGGFLSDNAKELCTLATEEGGKMVIVTDDDFSGWLMSSKVRDYIPRIGITLKTLRRLNIPIDKVSEELSSKNRHQDRAELLYTGGWYKDKETGEHLYEEKGYMPKEDWEFLTDGDYGQRIEIDNVIGYVGAETFWEDFVMSEFREQFPDADITRSVDVPEYEMPKCLEDLNEKVKKKGIEILKKRKEDLDGKLANFEGCFLFDRTDNVSDGLLTIPKYEETLKDHSRHIIESDEGIKPLLAEIEELAKDDDGDGNDNNNTSPSPPPSRPPIPPPRSARIETDNIVTDAEEEYEDDDYDYNYEQDPDCNDKKYNWIPKYVMPESLEDLNNMVKDRAIKITGPERKRIIKGIQRGENLIGLLTDKIENHIKGIIESHGSLKVLLKKIKDLGLEYDGDYQTWLKERDKEEEQQYGAPQTKTERRLRAELTWSATTPGAYCVIKGKRGTYFLSHDATFPPDYTHVYTNTDEDGHEYTADEWDRKQRGALTEEEFEIQIIRNLPGRLCDSHYSIAGSFVDDCCCCYVVDWDKEGKELGEHNQRYSKKFAGTEWVELVIKGKKQEYRAAPLRNIQYDSLIHRR